MLSHEKGHRIVNGNFLSEEWKRYLGEVRINRDDQIAVFPCGTFAMSDDDKNKVGEEKAQKFCFQYVARSILGTTNTTTLFCMPASKHGREKFNDPRAIRFTIIVQMLLLLLCSTACFFC